MQHYPIFADLKGRTVLLAGAGHVAERKAESLLQTGALVHVVAATLNPQFEAWQKAGQITWLGAEFQAAFVRKAFLVVAATDDHDLNRHIFEAAEAEGKLCNTVDNQALCSYIVPAVINRSPIQVAVSSGGASPVLARLWRQKIEALIPAHTGKMASLAGAWRQRVKSGINSLSERRRFWENLFASRFDTLVAQGNLAAAEQEFAAQLAGYQDEGGAVVLVGAGPGDAGLLTLHALQAMQAADVVLYDALVSPEIRALIRKDADKICVGKRAKLHQVQQEETNRLLVHYAQQGKRVVRLKGGDPFVFGRGGEEAQVLAQAGIPFRIVPGITAALGATAYAGIPLTHRDSAQTALFITGHCRPDGQDLHWQTLARGHQTLVIYMGTIKAAEIAAQLIAHGRSEHTPVAVISNGTLAQQSVQTGVLRNLPDLAAQAERPALMVIGEVVALRDELAWFGEGAVFAQ